MGGALLTIGEFSRATQLTIKALRHYDDVGLLQPAQVHPSSRYRRYSSRQIPVAHVIRRFRDLEMPLEQIREVLEAPDVVARDRAIIRHLERMEEALEQTQTTVASLRALLEGKEPALPVEYRTVAATTAIAVRDNVEWNTTESWLVDACGELHEALAADRGARTGPDSALYSTEFFEQHTGEVVAFVPISREPAVRGRVQVVDVPAADLAVTVHRGPFSDIDQAYGALGTFVAERVIGAGGPIRELYLVTAADTDDTARHRTEVCWPIHRQAAEGHRGLSPVQP